MGRETKYWGRLASLASWPLLAVSEASPWGSVFKSACGLSLDYIKTWREPLYLSHLWALLLTHSPLCAPPTSLPFRVLRRKGRWIHLRLRNSGASAMAGMIMKEPLWILMEREPNKREQIAHEGPQLTVCKEGEGAPVVRGCPFSSLLKLNNMARRKSLLNIKPTHRKPRENQQTK